MGLQCTTSVADEQHDCYLAVTPAADGALMLRTVATA
jgi:hypothetical protein